MEKIISAVMIAGLLTLAACGSKINGDNYAKLNSGMTRDAVHAILGDPTDVSGGGIGNLTMATETWVGPKQVVHVTYGNDKLAFKSIEAAPVKQ